MLNCYYFFNDNFTNKRILDLYSPMKEGMKKKIRPKELYMANSWAVKNIYVYIFLIRMHCVDCGILVPWPGIELSPLAVKAWSPNHWTVREFLKYFCFDLEQWCPHCCRIRVTSYAILGYPVSDTWFLPKVLSLHYGPLLALYILWVLINV